MTKMTDKMIEQGSLMALRCLESARNGHEAACSCYPVTGSFSRSAVNNSTGAMSQLSGVITAVAPRQQLQKPRQPA